MPLLTETAVVIHSEMLEYENLEQCQEFIEVDERRWQVKAKVGVWFAGLNKEFHHVDPEEWYHGNN